jgi:aminoglycoside phosphotransferase (APT) family kinase protein
MDIVQLVKDHILFFEGDIHIEPIYKGYSGDYKYIVSNNGRRYLLRTFPMNQQSGKMVEYEALQVMEQYGVSCSKPLDIGTIQEYELGYMVLTYIEGNEATDVLQRYLSVDQYRIGSDAGRELHKIHQYAAPQNMTSWYDRKLFKHNKCMEEYARIAIRINNDEKIMSFIDDHLPLMNNRPNQFQHDDFHIGNLIINDGGQIGVIDFNRCDWGDPVHDFLKVGLFSSEVSVPFSIGQIRGYHLEHDPDELFWRLYSLYLAMNVFASVVWILKVKPEEIDIMMQKLNRVLDDHDHFDLIKPKWYVEGETYWYHD